MKRAVTGVVGLSLVSCASQGWDDRAWMAQSLKTVSSGPYGFAAVPVEGGFKFRLTIRTDGNFQVAGAEGPRPSPEAVEQAAREAAPEGCTLERVEFDEAGASAIAHYDCI